MLSDEILIQYQSKPSKFKRLGSLEKYACSCWAPVSRFICIAVSNLPPPLVWSSLFVFSVPTRGRLNPCSRQPILSSSPTVMSRARTLEQPLQPPVTGWNWKWWTYFRLTLDSPLPSCCQFLPCSSIFLQF